MKNKKTLYRVLYIVCAVVAGTFLILDRLLDKWYFFVIGIVSLALVLLILFLMQKNNKLEKIEDNNDDNSRLKAIIENPKTPFEIMLKEAYDGILIDHLKPLYIKECNVYADDEEFGLELIIKANENITKVLINNTKISFNDDVKEYQFSNEAELYEYIKNNVD